jgi:hypothetical protein
LRQACDVALFSTLDILKITPDCEALSGLTADAIVFISLFLDYLAIFSIFGAVSSD